MDSPTGRQVPLDDVGTFVKSYQHATAEITRWRSRAQRAHRRILETMAAAGATVGTLDGDPVAWFEPDRAERFNVDQFREAHPDLARVYTYASGVPRLRVARPAKCPECHRTTGHKKGCAAPR